LKPSLLQYYGRRAREYEHIYDKPERETDLAALTSLLQNVLAGEDVLEIACGTGYWTARLARVARSICATDAAAEPLELARRKSYPPGRVRLELADAYAPDAVSGQFTAGFAGFWWSHVRREELPRFIGGLHRRLGLGARVVFCDNRYVEGSSTPVDRVDTAGNSYQRRRLENGEQFEVLKNFPTPDELDWTLHREGAAEISLTQLTYYWCVTYRVGAVTLNHWS
jgi:SAM-dependent methyltransferase